MMGLKIKWNDDRVQGATTAVLLIVRDGLAHGRTGELIQVALAEYRADPVGYKQPKATWPAAREMGPLTKPQHIAYYQNLLAAVDRVTEKMTKARRQFNSLLELDNALLAYLKDVR